MRGSTDVSPSTSSLVAFKPRQVLLLEQQRRKLPVSTPMAKKLKPEDESILNVSVALWLENKGFSKVLKRFLSAAQIQDDNWRAKALNLDAIFSKYQEICNGAHENLKHQKQQEEQVDGTTEANGDANCTAEEIGNKKKKKKKKSKGDTAVADTGRASQDKDTNGKTNESYENDKEDQSYKPSDDPSHDVQKSKSAKKSNGDGVFETVDESTKKQKDKKKKKNKSQAMDADEKNIDVMPEVADSKHKGLSSKSSAAELVDRETTADKKSKKRSDEAADDGVNESKKASKKRKRMAPDENGNQSGQEVAVEESKPKKTKGLEEVKDILPQIAHPGANVHAGEQNKEEKFQASQEGFQNLAKQTDERAKGSFDNGVDKFNQPKSAMKQQKSSESKTVNAFQRVKVEEVKFADERLQDNSYWAKDGAEIGYGAKAQEVLGQVKGRGFRHEKTKKKRGSYRGGQIDLQSHSIKFNYSDEE